MFQETIKAYNEWLKFGCYFAKEACNKKDVLIAGYCNSEIQQCRYDLGRNFSLDDDERVFWVRDTSVWNDRNQGCVITDWGIRIINDNDHPEDIILLVGMMSQGQNTEINIFIIIFMMVISTV